MTEVVEGCMQAGAHASGGLIGDFDGILQYASGDDVLLWGWSWFSGDEHPVVWVTFHRCLLQKSVQRRQPASHQVYILNKYTQII